MGRTLEHPPNKLYFIYSYPPPMERDNSIDILIGVSEVVQEILQNKCCLAENQYKNFWKNISKNEIHGTGFITTLLTKLEAIRSGEDQLLTLSNLVRKLSRQSY